MADEKPKKAQPAKRRTNKRLELAQGVQKAIKQYGRNIETAESTEQLLDITFDLGVAIGRAKEGGVDDMTVEFAEDLARQHMEKALVKISSFGMPTAG